MIKISCLSGQEVKKKKKFKKAYCNLSHKGSVSSLENQGIICCHRIIMLAAKPDLKINRDPQHEMLTC